MKPSAITHYAIKSKTMAHSLQSMIASTGCSQKQAALMHGITPMKASKLLQKLREKDSAQSLQTALAHYDSGLYLTDAASKGGVSEDALCKALRERSTQPSRRRHFHFS